VLAWVVSPTLIGRVFLEDPFDIGAERCDLTFVEHAIEYGVSVCLETLGRCGDRVRTELQVSRGPSYHSLILPRKSSGGQWSA
jgi:hypothetical protein